MTIYEKNSKAFEGVFPGWLEEVEKYAEENKEALSVQAEIGRAHV